MTLTSELQGDLLSCDIVVGGRAEGALFLGLMI